MEDYIYHDGPEENFIDDEVDEITDAENSILCDNGEDIDNIGNITDEDIDAYEDDEDLDEYTYDDTCDEEDCDTIDYEITGSEEEYGEEEIDDDIESVYDNEY